MSHATATALTPYDTGEMLEPKVHPGTTGMVDFDDDESATVITLCAWPTEGVDDSVTVQIDTHGSDHVKIVINDGTVFNESVETVGPEPTDTAYAAFGRYVAALLGSHEEWSGAGMLEEIAEYASNLTGFPLIGGQSSDEYTLWREVAGQLGIEHDGEDNEVEV
jgi:hypothetical protein